ncbi:hypothetical protein LCGC14_1945280, partial [marine sediment metagenome]
MSNLSLIALFHFLIFLRKPLVLNLISNCIFSFSCDLIIFVWTDIGSPDIL